jgi:membrane protease YdiL (CAAX protease family)
MMFPFRRFSLVLFFLLAFLFPWLIWGTKLFQARFGLTSPLPQPLAFWIGLNLATYIAAWFSGGLPAIRDLINRIIRWRVHPVWYICAFFLTGIISLIAISLHAAFGGHIQTGGNLEVLNLIPSFLFQVFFFLLTEESAWRGFALPRLQVRFNSLNASLILGLIWGFWHVPLFFMPGSFQSTISFPGFILSTLAMSVLTTWIYNHSHGSVLITAIFHAATDMTIASSHVMTGDIRLFWIFVAVQWLAALTIITLSGKEFFVHKAFSEESSSLEISS